MASRGHPGELVEALAALRQGFVGPARALGTDYRGAGAHLLRATWWFAEPHSTELPTLDDVRTSADEPALLASACALGARAAMLSFDLAGFHAWLGLLKQFDAGPSLKLILQDTTFTEPTQA